MTAIQRGIIALAAIVAAFVAGAGIGLIKGRQEGRIEQLTDTVRAYADRKEVDDETSSLADVGLCLRLGGVPDDCEQLRGMVKSGR